jgi:hypothetical protein
MGSELLILLGLAWLLGNAVMGVMALIASRGRGGRMGSSADRVRATASATPLRDAILGDGDVPRAG